MHYKKYSFSLFFLPLLFLIASCKTMYLPNMQNVPRFEKKGDVQATLGVTNFQLAWAPINHVGLIVNGYYKNKDVFHLDDGKTYNYAADAHALEGGIGTFWQYEDRSLEMYVGGGKGYGELTFSQSGATGLSGSASHYNKFFIQPIMGFENHEWKASFSLRLSFLNFYDFVEYSGKPIQTTSPYFIDPAITVSREVEWFRIKGQLQYSLASEDLSTSYGSYYMPYESMVMGTLAIEVDLDKLFERK